MEEIDSQIDKNINVSSMSERQAILFLEKSGANIMANSKSEPRNVVLDYHKYFIFKKKQCEQKIPKEKIKQRKEL